MEPLQDLDSEMRVRWSETEKSTYLICPHAISEVRVILEGVRESTQEKEDVGVS